MNAAHIGDDLCDLLIGEALLAGHVAEVPVMGAHTIPDREEKGAIGVMRGLVDLIDEGWALVSALTPDPMASSARSLIGDSTRLDVVR